MLNAIIQVGLYFKKKVPSWVQFFLQILGIGRFLIHAANICTGLLLVLLYFLKQTRSSLHPELQTRDRLMSMHAAW